MKITLTRNTLVAGVSYEEGDVVDASDHDAKFLIGIEKAVPFEAKAKVIDPEAAAAAEAAKAEAEAVKAAEKEAAKAARQAEKDAAKAAKKAQA